MKQIIAIVGEISASISRGEFQESEFEAFRTKHPKIYNTAVSESEALSKPLAIQNIIKEKESGLTQYNASIKFGETLAKAYFPNAR